MKVTAIKTTLASLILAGLSTSALAYDGEINITGELIETTCKIEGGTGTAVKNVTLPTLSKSALADANSWAGRVPVSFQLSGCDVGTTGATAIFENGANISVDGNMKNLATVNPASNVEVQLLNASAEVINLAIDTVATPIIGEAGTLQFYAQYFSKDGSATAGQVTSRVEFSLTYN